MEAIAHVFNGYGSKFGIPRQSGLAEKVISRIVFEKEYRVREAVRGIEEYSHLWLIWEFSENKDKPWSPTVRPPRLGGNERKGVFATRSPFRPNPIGLSCVKLESVELEGPDAPVLVVSGADLMDGTPVFDIKPYIPYSDIKEDALGGITASTEFRKLDVAFAPSVKGLSKEFMETLADILRHDPRPGYQDDPLRVYGFLFGGYDVHFTVAEGQLTVTDVVKA